MEWERLEISSRKLETAREYSCKDGLDKGQKWYGPNRSIRYLEEVARIHRSLYGSALTTVREHWKDHSLDYTDLCWQSNVSAFQQNI